MKAEIGSLKANGNPNQTDEEGDGLVKKENHQEDMPSTALHRCHWKRIHHSPLFWIGFLLFFVAISIYLLTDDLSWRTSVS
jgi:hypothetical protein